MSSKKKADIAVTTVRTDDLDDDFSAGQEAIAKAQLAKLIASAIKKNKFTQKQAAELIGIDQPKISAIIRGQLSGFTIDRLFRYLIALGMDITIEAKPHPSDLLGSKSADSKRPAIYVRQ